LKSINGIVGSILVILGVLSLAASVIVVAGVCAKTMAAAALLHVATCDQTTATFFVLLLLGIAFMIAGAIVLLRGRQKHATMPKTVAPEAEPPKTQPAMPVVYCHHCGKQMPSGSLYCNQCGTRL
jgi:membrane-bound ClpP family serine protease